MRGRHFGFLVSLCAVWIAARVGFLSILTLADAMPQIEERQLGGPRNTQAVAAAVEEWAFSPRTANAPKFALPIFARSRNLRTTGEMLPDTGQWLPDYARQLPDNNPPTSVQPFLPPATSKPRSGSPLAIYAYSFIREGVSGGAPLGSGQYGGSQSGLIATYALSRFENTNRANLSLLLRGAIAHDDIAERELAAGLRWHPVRDIPISLTLERRFRNARSDAFAAFVAGGVSEARLPLDFRLDAYAQAGFVTNKDGGTFFDASARAEREIAQLALIPVRAGVGMWTGGQEGIFRVDVGPTISGQIPIADTRLRVSADWRFRIAGDARPAGGPALTLSTAF